MLTQHRVCRHLRGVCLRALFQEPPPLTPPCLASRIEGLTTASKIGRYVRKLSISLVTLNSKDRLVLSSIFGYLDSLTDLKLVYVKEDRRPCRSLIRACCRRTSLINLCVEEAGLDITTTPADPGRSASRRYFVDHLIQAILKVDTLHLETFAHIASLPLHLSTFTALRARAAHLRKVVFRTSIQSNLRATFNQPTQWASASRLEELTIRTCSGVNLASVAIHVANGVFGRLKKLSVIRSGYDDHVRFAAVNQPRPWTIGILERLDIDHADHSEVTALSTIHVQEVYATRVYTSALISALNGGGWPGLRKLHTHPQGSGAGPLLLALKGACDRRTIGLETDAKPYGNCDCHDE
jgi:hypothetical protein